MIRFILTFSISICLAIASHAQDLEQYLHAVVQVSNKTGFLFSPGNSEAGSGTGFIVGQDGDDIIIFTNEHVVSNAPSFSVQKIEVGFSVFDENGIQMQPETVEATPVFVSPIYDFAVLKVAIGRLKRAHETITALSLIDRADLGLQIAKPGRGVFAIGNPLGSTNSFTFGHVNTMHNNLHSGPMIQTDTPINPGNSGGPLIDAETGQVIGMNTLKRTDADNMGFALPIWDLIEDYERFLQDPGYQIQRDAPWTTAPVAQQHLAIKKGAIETIEERFPQFFIKHKGVLQVDNLGANSDLKAGDKILAVNDQTFGIDGFALSKIVARQAFQTPLKVTVLRLDKIIDLKIRVLPIGNYYEKSERDFVILSGLLLLDLSPIDKTFIYPSQTGVKVSDYIPGGFAAEHDLNLMEANIVAVEYHDKVIPIRNLKDLREFLRGKQEGEFFSFHYQTPYLMMTNEGKQVMRDVDGFPIVSRKIQVGSLPVYDVIDSSELNVPEFKASFDWANPLKSDWRRAVSCQSLLANLDKA